MSFPGEACRIDPLKAITDADAWSDPESWAWIEICEGRDANFNRYINLSLNPRNPLHDHEWNDPRRTLSRQFLRSILLREPYRSAIPYRGVSIVGAYFPDGIDLSDAMIEIPLQFTYSYLKSAVDLRRLSTPSFVSFANSKLDEVFTMDSATVGTNLLLKETELKSVILNGADIGGQVAMVGSSIKQELNMNSTVIGDSLIMMNAAFSNIIMRGMRVGDTMSMDESTLTGDIDMDSASIGSDLFMRRAKFVNVILRGVEIDQQLNLEGSIFAGSWIWTPFLSMVICL